MAETTSYTDHNGKEIKVQKGKNVRISDKSHKTLAAYCKKKGYNLGAFCDKGAINQMKTEQANNF